MKLLPRLQNKQVTIIFQPHKLSCLYIQSKKNGPLQLRGYKQYFLDHLELEKLILYNPTKIKKYITNFLTIYNVKDAFVLFTLSGPAVFERYETLTTAHAQPTDFKLPELKQLHWKYKYLYPADNGKSVYYVCGIPPHILFQYKLLAITTGLNVLNITTKRMALHHTYKHMYGSAFRHAQLGIDMMQHNNMIEYVFSLDTLGRILHIPNTITINKTDEMINLLSACGLIATQRSTV